MRNADLINFFYLFVITFFLLPKQNFPKKNPSYIIIIYKYYILEEQ